MKHPSSAFQQYLIPKIGWKLLKSPFWWDSRKENSGTQGGRHTAKLPVAGEVFSLGILRLFVDYRYFCIKLVLTQFLKKAVSHRLLAWQFKEALPLKEGVSHLLHSPWLIPTVDTAAPIALCSVGRDMGMGHGDRTWALAPCHPSARPATQPGSWRNCANTHGSIKQPASSWGPVKAYLGLKSSSNYRLGHEPHSVMAIKAGQILKRPPGTSEGLTLVRQTNSTMSD